MHNIIILRNTHKYTLFEYFIRLLKNYDNPKVF